jgi:hypothetical protein
MSGIKGLVILSRFDYIENTYGQAKLKEISGKIKPDSENPLNQPIGISKEYPELLLGSLDRLITMQLLDNDEAGFLEIGYWNARHLMPRYFQIYMDDKDPDGFLKQMSRMRDHLIGLGELIVAEVGKNSYVAHINYGQQFMESVRLSELGFLIEGCRLCGAKNLQWEEVKKNETSVEYKIDWE